MAIKFIETTTKDRATKALKDMLALYGLDFSPEKLLPASVNGQLVMRNLTNLNDRDLKTSSTGLQVSKKIGENSAKTSDSMNSIAIGLHKALDFSSKALTAFQTIEDFSVVPATGLTIGNNIIIVADRLSNGSFGAKFAIIPKELQTVGNKLNWVSGKGNAIGLTLSIGTFTLDRIAGEPIKCSSVFDVGMSAAPVIAGATAASGGTFGIVVIVVSGVYAALDLVHQFATGDSFSKYIDGACNFVANTKPKPLPTSYTAQQLMPNSSDFARYQFMGQGR